tara:strand:- start:2286 stop:2489 length:204 start_codon:yes stop_codon:yes gene_type:complete
LQRHRYRRIHSKEIVPMNSGTKSAVPSWYWVVAIVSLLWSLMGRAAFSMELFAQDAVMESRSWQVPI